MTKLIFIGGVHGVGKGTMCTEVAAALGFKHYTASELLKWKEVSEDEKNKKVGNIKQTQDRLIAGLQAAIKEEGNYILDGHFCLFNADGKVERVPENTFDRMSPQAFVVVTEEIKIIAKRLHDRDKKSYSMEELDSLQNMEAKYASDLAIRLGIPLLSVKSGDLTALKDFLTAI